jgi:hypothetical protein
MMRARSNMRAQNMIVGAAFRYRAGRQTVTIDGSGAPLERFWAAPVAGAAGVPMLGPT